jgi:hypothetical protein
MLVLVLVLVLQRDAQIERTMHMMYETFKALDPDAASKFDEHLDW